MKTRDHRDPLTQNPNGSAAYGYRDSVSPRRERVVLVLQALTLGAVILVAQLPPITRAEWHAQWWIFIVFVLVVAIQTAYRTSTGNPLRRITSSAVEGSVMVALYWLSPWLAVTGRVAGAILGWLPTRLYHPKTQLYYAMSFATEMVVIVALFNRFAPTSPLQGWQPLAKALVVWGCFVIGRIAAHVGQDWINGKSVGIHRGWLHIPAALVAGASTTFGLVGAMAIELSWLGLIPILILGFLLTEAGNSGRRSEIMRAAREQILLFSKKSHDADPETIGEELLVSVDAIRRYHTCALVHVDDGGELHWSGRFSPEIERQIRRVEDLERLPAETFALVPRLNLAVASWEFDEGNQTYVVVGSRRRPNQLRSFADAVGNLVTTARLGIINANQVRDLVERAEREHRLARTDPVTRLPNRLATLDEIGERVARGTRETWGLIGISIQDFARLSDVLGASAGEAVAVAYGRRLCRRTKGFVARIGPGSFVALIDGDEEIVDAAVKRLGGSGKAAVGDEVFTYNVLIGATMCEPGSTASAEELLGRVDLAVRRCFKTGVPEFFGDEDAAKEARKLAIRSRLPDAIAAGEVQPAFQPQIDLRSGELAGVEVLARWNDSVLGTVYPDEFIEVAETSQQIEALTISILEQSLAAAARWKAFGVEVSVSVNLSAQSLGWPKFLDFLASMVTDQGVDSSLLTVEITESTLAAGDTTLAAVERLSSVGSRISIDDFGTGYSALSYLDAFPINEIKIDRSMILTLGDIDAPNPIVRRLIDMCHELGYSVVAEGVETIDQAETLLSLDCDIVQGYYFARPMLVDEATEWLQAFRPFTLEQPAVA